MHFFGEEVPVAIVHGHQTLGAFQRKIVLGEQVAEGKNRAAVRFGPEGLEAFLGGRKLAHILGLTEENGPEKEEGNRQEASMW